MYAGIDPIDVLPCIQCGELGDIENNLCWDCTVKKEQAETEEWEETMEEQASEINEP